MMDFSDVKERTIEEAHELAQHAKLNLDELSSYVQCVSFASDHVEPDEIKLLELNAELLDVLVAGDSLIVRGDEEESSVMCTNNKTFEVRGAETSNTMLLLPELLFPSEFPTLNTSKIIPVKVLSTQCKYIELKQIQPKMHKLLHLLEENLYTGRKLNEEKCFTFSELLNRIQGSEEELLKTLKSMKAYKLKAYWVLLDFDYHFRVLSCILNYIEMKSMSLTAIPKHECIQVLKESESETILCQCFDHFFVDSGSKSDQGGSLYQIIDDDVCRFCAEVLLKPAQRFHLEEFLSIWQQSVPEGLCTSLNQLGGIAIIDRISNPPVICYFPTSNLPENLVDRFAILFDTKEKWTLDEIRPYLKEHITDKQPILTLLTKFARASNHNGIKYFSRRHPK